MPIGRLSLEDCLTFLLATHLQNPEHMCLIVYLSQQNLGDTFLYIYTFTVLQIWGYSHLTRHYIHYEEMALQQTLYVYNKCGTSKVSVWFTKRL